MLRRKQSISWVVEGGEGVDALFPADRLVSIGSGECFQLLADAEIGRFGFLVDGHPRITPVNFRLVEGDIIFLSRPGAKLDAAVHQQVVAFEVDAVEEWAQAGWSVLVVGVAAVVTDPGELARLSPWPAEPWAATSESSVVRIVPTEVTGRRVRVEPGEVTVVDQGA